MTKLEDIDPSDLLHLSNTLERFLRTADIAAQAYCEGWQEWEELIEQKQIRAAELRVQIKNLAIDLGIHAEFLAEYSQVASFNLPI